MLTYLNCHKFAFVISIKRRRKLISTIFNMSTVIDELYTPFTYLYLYAVPLSICVSLINTFILSFLTFMLGV